MRFKTRVVTHIATLSLLVAFDRTGVAAQIPNVIHDTGQDVAPVFEGWERRPDGGFNFVFGYLNRNRIEEVDIPIGPDNMFEGGIADRNQPTHFYPRRQRFVLRVEVPADWPKTQRMVWTLKSRGKTNQAKAWLQPEWELNDDVIAANIGGGIITEGNKAPEIRPADPVIAGGRVELKVTVKDDGLPKPPRRGAGLNLKWEYYRGSGSVEFHPSEQKAEYGATLIAVTSASLSAAGEYVLRALVSDGQLLSTHDFVVRVTDP